MCDDDDICNETSLCISTRILLLHPTYFFFYRFTVYTYSDYLVEVRAQVMARDESTEGWLPLQGGGLAKVSIRKRSRLSPEVKGHEYIIYGQRISDQTVSQLF